MRLADTSVAVAAFATWHEHHLAARQVLDEGVMLVDHCALETYSVLTRLPAPHRAEAVLVRDFIATQFGPAFVRLSPDAHRRFVLELPDLAVTGGAAYDALVAATAASHDAELFSCDRRAAIVYARYRARVRMLG